VILILVKILLSLLLGTGIFYTPGLTIRALARIPLYWTFVPAHTFVIVVTEEDNSGSGMKGSGNAVDVLHSIAGHYIDKSASDLMDWEVKKGVDPEHDTFLFRRFGVQSMGSVYHTLRYNTDKRLRYAREGPVGPDGKPQVVVSEHLHTVTKAYHTHAVYYQGELTVSIKEADTSDKLGVNFEIDFTFERQFPYRSVLRLADSAAFVTSLVEQIVNNHTVTLKAEAYIGGKGTKANREKLVKAIMNNSRLKKRILTETGINVREVSLRLVTMTEGHRKLIEQKTVAEQNMKAAIIDSKKELAVENNRTAWKKKRVEEVEKPQTANARSLEEVRWNGVKESHLTVYVEGGGKVVPTIPITP
jgi:hypothetical protein